MEHEKTPCPSPTCPICSKLKPEPKKLTLKERILKQRNENWESSERIWKKIQEQIKNELSLPVEIFHTRRGMDAYRADDLQCGDLNKGEIKKISSSFNENDFLRTANDMFRYFKDTARLLVINSEYEPLILELISHMEGNTGSKYELPALTKAMSSHRTTKQFSRDISVLISEELKAGKGKLDLLSPKIIQTKLMANSILPKFNSWEDVINGLGLSVHDVYSVQVILKQISIEGEQFKATLQYKIQDHFGLDIPDVGNSKIFHTLSFFRTWFILQRYNKMGYKPFITEMNFNLDIEGKF
ncbi:DUF3289 family protein [Photobacterium damselae]|uniref:DUF3289 family protein n=1 Tax=Photobacterium damselae TaxID=38293 RepID=UPI001EFE5D9E|nr:DUF3289 family protein [Photobacterium damselae]MCG9780729.1 DUF3289 family protein [Photobacterium damselae]